MRNKRLAKILGRCISCCCVVAWLLQLDAGRGRIPRSIQCGARALTVTPSRTACVFLVTISDDGRTVASCNVSGRPRRGIVIHHEDIFAGEVAEVVVIPSQASVGKTVQ